MMTKIRMMRIGMIMKMNMVALHRIIGFYFEE